MIVLRLRQTPTLSQVRFWNGGVCGMSIHVGVLESNWLPCLRLQRPTPKDPTKIFRRGKDWTSLPGP